MRPRLIYIHGFLSSAQSAKGLMVRDAVLDNGMNVDLRLPQLSNYPAEAIAQLELLVEEQPSQTVVLIGSSLGGFYATYLAQKYGVRAILINPGVAMPELIEHYLGENTNPYTEQVFFLDQQHVRYIQGLVVDRITLPERLFVMLQTGDEVCDYKLAVAKYSACKLLLEEGGDHTFVNFQQHLPQIFDFLQVS